MTQLEQLYRLYDAYEEKAKEVRSKASRFAGVFGMGDDPRKHSCHEEFYEDVGRWVQDFLNEDPASEEIIQAVSWILKGADARRNSDVYWMMYVAQGHTKSLIPRMSREACVPLLQWYEQAYPEDDRLPVQQEVYGLLQKQSGAQKGSGRRGFWNLFRNA